MTIAQNLDLENSRRSYWLVTIPTGGNLSNQDLYQAFLKNKTSTVNLSNQDMEKIYWNGLAGTSGLSVHDAKRLTFKNNQFSELLWLRAQP